MSTCTNSSMASPHAATVRDRPVTEDQIESDNTRRVSDDNMLSPEVYLSLVWHKGQLGAAFYDLSSLQIHVISDVLEADDFNLTKQILKEIQPCVIILSSIQDGRLISCLKKFSSELGNNSYQSAGSNTESFKLEFLANTDFSYEVSKRRILGMKLPSIPDHMSEEERKVYFASLLSLGQINMVRAIGGLYKYLERNRVGVELEDNLTSVPILGFRSFVLENFIHIDAMTYVALNIFDTEMHPSVYKCGGSGGKEGLSLFGILNRCRSSIGSKMLRQWFLRPVKNAALLGQRHDAISFFVTPQNMDVVSCLQGCLKHMKYLPKILWRMSKARATVGDLEALYKTIYHAFYIGKVSRNQPQSVEIFRKICSGFTDDIQVCANLIQRTIDFEESKKMKKFVMKPHIDENLDEKMRLFHGMDDILNQVAREELESLGAEVEHCRASYLPQIGYLLVIDMPEGKTEDDDHTIEGLQFVFASNQQLYYKSSRTLELDNQLGDLVHEISDLEVNILHRLQDALLNNTQTLLDVMEMSAELDCLMALATCANEFAYVRPQLVQEGMIDIRGGRHPLQELCCSPYVPNDTAMGDQNSRIQILTGPNASGKSVYLKQVALIVFMSHIGSFVPAESACVGPVDQFFSRVKSVESVSSGMSTFLQDSLQISRALNEATHSSLVIVDEFGKGTESLDGLALLTAVIKFWVAKGAASPYVLVSTHYHSIIQQKLLLPSPYLKFLTLDTVMNGPELVFLYQIKEGSASSSYACHIAAQVEIPQNIVQRGKKVSELLSENKPVPCLRDGASSEHSKRHQHIVDGFMKLDLERDNLQTFLKDFLLQPKLSSNVRPQSKAKAECSYRQQAHQQVQDDVKKKKRDSNLPHVSLLAGDGASNNSNGPAAVTAGVSVLHSAAGDEGTSKPNTSSNGYAQISGASSRPPSGPQLWGEILRKKYAVATQSVEKKNVEQFMRTPLGRQPTKKPKLTELSTCRGPDETPGMKSASRSVCSPESQASVIFGNSVSDFPKSFGLCSTPSLDSHINEAEKISLPVSATRELLEGEDTTATNNVTSYSSFWSKLFMKKAHAHSTPKSHAPETATDFPVSDTSADLTEQIRGNFQTREQKCHPMQTFLYPQTSSKGPSSSKSSSSLKGLPFNEPEVNQEYSTD